MTQTPSGNELQKFHWEQKKSAKQKGQCWECDKMPEACAQNGVFTFYPPDIASALCKFTFAVT